MPPHEGHGGGPQRVVRGGDQYLVAVVEQRLHRHLDQLGDAVAEVDVLDVQVDALGLVVLHDRAARGEQPLRVTVTVGGAQVAEHVLKDLRRAVEAEGRGVARVELEDAMTCCFEPHRLFEHGAADLVTDIGEFG